MNQVHETSIGIAPVPAAALASAALIWPALSAMRWGPHRPKTGAWYLQLRKPSFMPPSVTVPLAWGVINSGLAAGAYRLLRRPPTPQRGNAVRWWALNVVLVGVWNGIFFGRRNLPVSTVVAAAMVGTGVAYIAKAQKVDHPAAGTGVAYVAWLCFATTLTAALWRHNR